MAFTVFSTAALSVDFDLGLSQPPRSSLDFLSAMGVTIDDVASGSFHLHCSSSWLPHGMRVDNSMLVYSFDLSESSVSFVRSASNWSNSSVFASLFSVYTFCTFCVVHTTRSLVINTLPLISSFVLTIRHSSARATSALHVFSRTAVHREPK